MKRPRLCYVCRQPTGDDREGYCLACCAVRDAIAAAHADDHATPHPEAKSRVAVYAARAARGEPLFAEEG